MLLLSNGLSPVLKAVPSPCLKTKVTAAGLASGDMLYIFFSLKILVIGIFMLESRRPSVYNSETISKTWICICLEVLYDII